MGAFGLGRRIMAVANQLLHGGAAIAIAAEHVQQHAVRDLKAGDEPFGRRVDEAGESLFIPVNKITFRRLTLERLAAVTGGLFGKAQIFDHVFRRLDDHPALVIESLASGATADLMKIPRGQNAHLLAIELAETREEDGTDGDVNAHAQRIGATDDFEQALLRELFHQHAILGQQAGVMQADAVPQPFFDIRPVRTAEAEPFNGLRNGFLLFAGAQIETGEILRALAGFQLGEVDDVGGYATVLGKAFDGLGERQFRVGVFERHRAVAGSHGDGGLAIQAGQRLLKERGVPERGGHEQEPRLRHRQQRHLPGHATVAVGVIMKFIHHHIMDIGGGAFAQGDVRQNFGGAAKDGRIVVHGAITGAEADVIRAELAAEGHELLIHQRLDGTGIDGPLPLPQGLKMQGGGDQGFARAGGSIENDVLLLEQFEDGGFLRGVQFQVAGGAIFEEASQQQVVAGRCLAGNQFVKRGGHWAGSLPVGGGAEKHDSNNSSFSLAGQIYPLTRGKNEEHWPHVE